MVGVWRRVAPSVALHVWPIGDQMLISATNFLTTVLLARGLTVVDFGYYTLIVSVLLLANTIQGSLVTQPHNVLGADLAGQPYQRYTTATALSQLLLMATGALLALLAAFATWLLGWPGAPIACALALALVAWQGQEFARRVLYTEERVAAVFCNDLITCSAQSLLVALLWRYELLNAASALAAMASGWLLGAAWGLWQVRRSLEWSFDFSAVVENWRYGKWLLGGELLGHWLATQVLMLLTALALGAAAAGVLRAVHTLLGPCRVLAQVFSTALPTRLARVLSTRGPAALLRLLVQVHLLAIPTLGGYCLLAAIFARPLLASVYGDQYAEYHSVLALYAVSAFLGYLTMIAAAALRAKCLTRAIFMAELLSLPVILLGAVLLPVLGIHGVILGVIASDVVLLVLSWKAHSLAAERQSPPAAIVSEVSS